jgi:hypothetical protein
LAAAIHARGEIGEAITAVLVDIRESSPAAPLRLRSIKSTAEL